MTTFKLPLRILFVIVALCHYNFASAKSIETHGLEIREVIPSSGSSATKYLLEIDLASCQCQDVADDCQIAIAKSSVLATSCPKSQLYCCTGRTKHEDQSTLNIPASLPLEEDDDWKAVDEDNEPMTETEIFGDTNDDIDDEAPRSLSIESENVMGDGKIRVVSAQDILPLEEEEEEIQPEPKKCRCKAKEECDEKYMDYRLLRDHLHCGINMTRCCEPESEILRQLTDTGRHIFPDINKRVYNEEAVPDEHGRIPIPLPEIKIPITEPIEDTIEGQGQSQGEDSRSTLAAPPTLPTFYNYQSPNNYAGYYSPQPRPLPPPPTLDNTGYDDYRGGNYYNQGSQRQFPSDNSGLIQKLSTLFG